MPKKLELFFWQAVPQIVALLLAILVLTPKNMADLGSVFPLLHMLVIYYWSVVHVRDMPLTFVIALGVLVDVATGTPFGVNALSYAAFCLLIYSRRKTLLKEGFSVKWGYFCFALFLMLVLEWLLVGMLGGRFVSIYHACIQWAITVLCYPLAHHYCYRLFEHSNYRRYKVLHA